MRFSVVLAALLTIVTFSTHSAQAQGTDTALWNFYDGLPVYLSFRLPQSFNKSKIIAYSERFVSPYPKTYVDSVGLSMEIDSLGDTSKNFIAVNVRHAIPYNSHFFTDFGSTPIDVEGILPSDIRLKRDTTYVLPYYGDTLLTDSTFFISVELTDTANTIAWLDADSVTSPTLSPVDESVDRAQFHLDSAYNGSRTWYMAQTQWQTMPGLYDYSNFVMVAYVSTPSGGVAEVYPADLDPLTFFVERAPDGSLTLHYTLPDASDVALELYDRTGRKVQTIVSLFETMGQHEVELNNTSIVSGMYYARLMANGTQEVHPVVIAH
jgi:hypothetical protein